MKSLFVVALGLLLLTTQAFSEEKTSLKSQKEKTSYALGLNIGNNIKNMTVDIAPELFFRGFKDALSGAAPAMSEEEIKTILGSLQKDLMAKQAERIKQLGDKNKKEGESFLSQNSKKEGVKTLPSGLQYKVLKEGNGKLPKVTDKVVCHYQGTLLDGTEFDSSYKRNEPSTFPVKGVIPGWTEALQKMKVGSKWQLFIPAKLAYGEQGAGPKIGPNAVLIFTIELISIV